MLAALRGERDALRRVWEDNRRWLAAVVLAHKPAWAEVDDILQDVAATMVAKIGHVREPEGLRPWLRMVAANAARAASRDLSHRRRALAFPTGEAVEPGPTSPDAGEGAGRRETEAEGRRLLELAAKLPEGYREPLILRCVKDMSYREIGAVLGLPETTVETRIARGRRMLRELAANPEGQPKARGASIALAL